MVVTVKCNLQQQMGHWHQYITHMRAGEGESIVLYCIRAVEKKFVKVVMVQLRQLLFCLLCGYCQFFVSFVVVVPVTDDIVVAVVVVVFIILDPRKLILEYSKNWVSKSFNIKYFWAEQKLVPL